MAPVWYILGVFGIVLQLVVIYLMTKGFYRKYPWVFGYLLVLFFTSVADFAGWSILDPSDQSDLPAYLLNDTIRHFSAFLAVVSLFLAATAEHPRRRSLRWRVISISLLFVAGSLLWNSPSISDPATYYTYVFRDVSFITALLNVVLWFSLVRNRTTDRVLYLVSGGLGLNMAGVAIAESLYTLSNSTVLLVNLLGVGSHLLCLLIWIKAFRLSPDARKLPSREPTPFS